MQKRGPGSVSPSTREGGEREKSPNRPRICGRPKAESHQRKVMLSFDGSFRARWLNQGGLDVKTQAFPGAFGLDRCPHSAISICGCTAFAGAVLALGAAFAL